MDIILQLIGCAALIIAGLVFMGGGALGESMPAFISGFSLAVVGVGLILSKATKAAGFSISDVSFTISGDLILIVLTGIVGVIIVAGGLKLFFK